MSSSCCNLIPRGYEHRGTASFQRAQAVRSHANERFGAKLRCDSRERINSGSESYLAESFWESLQPKRKRTFVRARVIIPSMCGFVPGGVGDNLHPWKILLRCHNYLFFCTRTTAALGPASFALSRLISTPLANSLQLSPMLINISCDARTPKSNPLAHISARDLPF